MLLASLEDQFFHYSPAAEAFQRLRTVARKRGKIMSFDELCEDPALSEDVREALVESPNKIVKSLEQAEGLFHRLDEFRKARALYQISKDIAEKLREDKVDVEEMIDSVSDSIVQARSRDPMIEVIHTVGAGGNAQNLMEEALSPDDEVLFKTGMDEFDERSGGLPSKGVVILAATTSGGKSTVLMNMLDRMYLLNKVSVANISLEMNEKKVARRWGSMKTGIPFWKFTKRQMTRQERRQAIRAWQEHHEFGEKHGILFSTITPKGNVSIQQVLSLSRPYGYKIIGIDYIGLLDGTDGDDQWRKLSAIARECKIYSEQNNCLIILLAQLDSDSDKIRYSRGIVEHADNVWTWNYADQKQRDLHVLPVMQLKARDQELYPFDLEERFDIMTVRSVVQEGGSPMEDDEEQEEQSAVA